MTWAKKIKVRGIAGIDDYSEQEKSDSFYGPSDFQRIRDEIAEVCFLMKHGTKESEELSYRGLELKRDGECRRRKLHRWCVNMAVFEETDRQHDDGFHDVEAIGDIYKLLTKQSRAEALERAIKDAEDVNQHCDTSLATSDESLDIERKTKPSHQVSGKASRKPRIATKPISASAGIMEIDGCRGMTVLSLVAQQ